MDHQEFEIGLEFQCGGKVWRCTDVGTRTIAAICVSEARDGSWLRGPPYAIVESVFNEYDFGGCKTVGFDGSSDPGAVS